MISPNTAPGTKVVFIRKPRCILTRVATGEFNAGDEVTIADIFPSEFVPSGYSALLDEGDRFYCLSLFRLAALPDCLVEAQHSQPLVPDSEKQRVNADDREREHLRQFLPFD
jgi:hypothetical protein